MAETTQGEKPQDESKRDFLYLSTAALAVIGTGYAIWPVINSMNPAADTLALATIDVDISAVEVGQAITVTWRGKPVFIRHRTEAEIAEARADDSANLPDPQTDEERTIVPQWLVMVGICTHLGCVPLGQQEGDERGDYAGWFCPCHGSHYDTAGRIRRGPAPLNLEVPEYVFLDDTNIRLG